MDEPSSELMNLVAGGKSGPPIGGGETPSTASKASGAGPVSSPMSTPQENAGDKQQAMVTLSIVFDLLERALQQFGAETVEGQEVNKSLSGLVKAFGQKRQEAKELQPAELIALMQNLPAGGGMTPEMQAMAGMQPKMPPGQPAQPQMKPPMPPAGAPPQMPMAA